MIELQVMPVGEIEGDSTDGVQKEHLTTAPEGLQIAHSVHSRIVLSGFLGGY